MHTGDWNMVLLRHDVPDGSWHFDWMLDLPGVQGARGVIRESGGLVTFRIRENPQAIAVGAAAAAERLGLHRREYLMYEGEISGGRGRVARVLAGRVRLVSATAGWLEFAGAFEGSPEAVWGARELGGGWAAAGDGAGGGVVGGVWEIGRLK